MADVRALELRGVSVSYGSHPALVEVDVGVDPGEFVALAGPNGSGKTTLIRAVLGFLAPARGDVRVFGSPIAELSPRFRARSVAWVPQDEPARDDVPLLDYVLYGRYAHQEMLEGESAEDVRIAREVLEQVGLADRAEDGILSISGGERQRAILARALAQKPKLLLLDEPTSHLDIGHQLDILGRVRGLARRRGVTVVAALHDLNLAARFADRIVVLSHGRVVADGPASSVLSEELLRRVWGVAAELRRDPRTGTPFLIPYPLPLAMPAADRTARGTVHVVGGGGAAGTYLRGLTDGGWVVSAGVLHLLDSDTETAAALGIPIAEEVPFAPLGEVARARQHELLAAAHAIVVAPFAVGPSNLANLEDLRPFAGRIPIWLVAEPPIRERDFSGGHATEVYEVLRSAGAREVHDLSELLEALRDSASAMAPRPSADDGPRLGEQRTDV
ncbi:MAG: ABC transporter ATP-binding protein [Thermoplasmata archaeon]